MSNRLPKIMIFNREPQFAAEITKKLNSMLGIQIRLLIAFHSQIDRQTKYINQELEQYLWFFLDHKQKNQPKQLVFTEFAVRMKQIQKEAGAALKQMQEEIKKQTNSGKKEVEL